MATFVALSSTLQIIINGRVHVSIWFLTSSCDTLHMNRKPIGSTICTYIHIYFVIQQLFKIVIV